MKLLMALGLAAQFLFPKPITHAYALQVKKDVVVSVTYTDQIPRETCVEAFGLDDPAMLAATKEHCWKPETSLGDLDVWEGESINDWNFRVTVRYPNGEVVVINLTSYLNS